ncbi:MAG: nucleoside 2-deoxyribosyltransferase [Anaerolineae bacterium]|nr:nucleoside 2-deoxyribosyltransferase [Anaerolineae bacterium]
MRAYIAIKYHEDQRNRPRIEALTAALTMVGFSTCCIVRDIEAWGQVTFDAPTLMQRTFTEIDRSDLVIIDFAEKGVGVGIEAGYACAKGLPIIVIAPENVEISTTLAGIATHVYRESDTAPLTLHCAALAAKMERTCPERKRS